MPSFPLFWRGNEGEAKNNESNYNYTINFCSLAGREY